MLATYPIMFGRRLITSVRVFPRRGKHEHHDLCWFLGPVPPPNLRRLPPLLITHYPAKKGATTRGISRRLLLPLPPPRIPGQRGMIPPAKLVQTAPILYSKRIVHADHETSTAKDQQQHFRHAGERRDIQTTTRKGIAVEVPVLGELDRDPGGVRRV
jgi:hypothetical protein